MLRFHLDEHVSHAIANGLRRRNIDVTTTTDAGLLHASDEEHLAFAVAENRVIFTNDHDFLRLAAAGLPHAGIVYCPPEKKRIGAVIQLLALLSDLASAAEMANRVEYL